ncbi:hypothetical protein [Lysinibacillus fusiformis]
MKKQIAKEERGDELLFWLCLLFSFLLGIALGYMWYWWSWLIGL